MKIEFIASLANTVQAIQISGEGDVRLRLDIPASELANATKMILMKGKAFKVIIDDGKNK